MPRNAPLWLVAVPLLPFLAGCSGDDAAANEAVTAPPRPPAERIRLFDLMAEARFGDATDEARTPAPATTVSYDFDSRRPEGLWLARAGGRSLTFDGVGEIADDAGREGAGLRLGPGMEADRSPAILLVPVPPLAQVRVRAAVRLENNPQASEASSREVLQLFEHTQEIDDPEKQNRWTRRRLRRHRVSRLLDPTGWDRIDHEIITGANTRTLEVHLLHRTGKTDKERAVTRYDDVEIEIKPLDDAGIRAHIADSYAPDDGRGDADPWRLRVALSGADRRSEVRDAILLPPPATIGFPLRVPDADTKPVLRFHYGMVREAHSGDGDGAAVSVEFVGDDGERAVLGKVAIDPRHEREHRRWQEARMDLTAVAGREGLLEFRSTDAPPAPPKDEDESGADTGEDAKESTEAEETATARNSGLDAVVIATPRIEPAEKAAPGFNVLLIGVDTLRADHLSAFGYERPTTPNLAAVADEGVRFASTRSQAPWTLPSFSSILTSLYPSTHGAGRGGHDEWTGIDPTTTSIAEIMQRYGWETQGVVANGLISPRYGLDQGFDGYQSRWAMESVDRDCEAVAEWVDGHRTTPWLMFWHIMDPHLPYTTSGELRERFTDADYDGKFAGGRRGPEVPFGALDPRPGRRWFAHEGPPPSPDLTDADKAFISDYYDAELAEMDIGIGRVLEALRTSGQYDRTIIALVADHGEGLGDHDHYHHGYTLFDDQVHIPMLLRIPGAHQGVTIDRPVAAIDLAPTILGALGLEIPEFFEGVDRLAEDAPTDDAHFIEYPTYDSSAQKAWVLGRFKYLHDPLFRTEALYDLQADPGEKTDIKEQHPEVVARARKEMDAFRWRELQKGRFHLRVEGKAGQKLRVRVDTDDLFDANFVTRPLRPEADFTMDLDRTHLVMETTLEDTQLELVCWCRGRNLRFDVTLDGAPCKVALGTNRPTPAPLSLARDEIPTAEGARLRWPERGTATLWLEAGVAHALPVVMSPEEIERMNELGYAK